MHQIGIRLAVSVVPALLFLLGLVSLDSYKLVRFRAVLGAMLWGTAMAAVAYYCNAYASGALGWSAPAFSRYGAPLIEEVLKGIAVVFLIRSHRVGFLVDAAILGFAIGTGFAVTENLVYLAHIPTSNIAVWIVRGCGTAVLHGGTTAIFSILAKSLVDRRPELGLAAFLPGALAAVMLHSFFNHFFFSPILSTVLILLLLPGLLVLVFRRSEGSLREWIGGGFDTETELLELIDSGAIADTRVGQYLHSLMDKFRGEVVADMLCYLRLRTELSIRAKGELMMREAGFKSRIEPEVGEKLQEMDYLEASLGATGRLALQPFLRSGGRSAWELRILREP